MICRFIFFILDFLSPVFFVSWNFLWFFCGLIFECLKIFMENLASDFWEKFWGLSFFCFEKFGLIFLSDDFFGKIFLVIFLRLKSLAQIFGHGFLVVVKIFPDFSWLRKWGERCGWSFLESGFSDMLFIFCVHLGRRRFRRSWFCIYVLDIRGNGWPRWKYCTFYGRNYWRLFRSWVFWLELFGGVVVGSNQFVECCLLDSFWKYM